MDLFIKLDLVVTEYEELRPNLQDAWFFDPYVAKIKDLRNLVYSYLSSNEQKIVKELGSAKNQTRLPKTNPSLG